MIWVLPLIWSFYNGFCTMHQHLRCSNVCLCACAAAARQSRLCANAIFVYTENLCTLFAKAYKTIDTTAAHKLCISFFSTQWKTFPPLKKQNERKDPTSVCARARSSKVCKVNIFVHYQQLNKIYLTSSIIPFFFFFFFLRFHRSQNRVIMTAIFFLAWTNLIIFDILNEAKRINLN